jgi:flagellar basal-body rod protein FlgC
MGRVDLNSVLGISSAGMSAQSTRLRVVAENVANQDSTGSTPGANPYRRKTVTFTNALDRAAGVDMVRVGKIGSDASAFPLRYDPSHPAADASGYVKTPNINSFVELMDMREAERGYNANLAVMQSTRGMMERTLELLK